MNYDSKYFLKIIQFLSFLNLTSRKVGLSQTDQSFPSLKEISFINTSKNEQDYFSAGI